ncbi:dehydrogenase [Clostridia bacterium]|nr:dehydrogenase [Clostridia bacterium]
MKTTKVGVIGCGTISGIYFENLTKRFKQIEVLACADIFLAKAEEAAQKYGIPIACSTEELLKNPEIEIVLNLTIPAVHTEINVAALKAGKHVYCEKPLALNMEDLNKTIDLAKERHLSVGCAPDTFMGAGLQTCRKLIDENWIGKPVSATVNFVSHGPETWHPSPEFYYKPGAGPLLDMGPYYLTALVFLLGPIGSISCFTNRARDKRVITSKAHKGEIIDVEVETGYCGILKFKSGTIVNVNMSFDVWLSNLPLFEIYGTKGTLVVTDPKMFGGKVEISRGEKEIHDFFKEIPLPYGSANDNLRGLGLADMAKAIQDGTEPRVNAELIYHVTEALLNFETAANGSHVYKMKSTCTMSAPIKNFQTFQIF